MKEEITKQKFKEFYFTYATLNRGWNEEYWNQFYEYENGKRYFFSPPASPNAMRMFIVSDDVTHSMIFLTEDAEESFFEFPGND